MLTRSPACKDPVAGNAVDDLVVDRNATDGREGNDARHTLEKGLGAGFREGRLD